MIRQCDLKVICLFDVNWLIYCEQVEDYNYLMCRDRMVLCPQHKNFILQGNSKTVVYCPYNLGFTLSGSFRLLLGLVILVLP